MPSRDQDVETVVGLHLLGQNLHRRMEDNSLERHRCGKHGHGVQEVLQGIYQHYNKISF